LVVVLILGGGGELGSNWGQRGEEGDYGDFLLNVMEKNETHASLFWGYVSFFFCFYASVFIGIFPS
jgi:hypothetical protein